jgi:hypothetical protein
MTRGGREGSQGQEAKEALLPATLCTPLFVRWLRRYMPLQQESECVQKAAGWGLG